MEESLRVSRYHSIPNNPRSLKYIKTSSHWGNDYTYVCYGTTRHPGESPKGEVELGDLGGADLFRHGSEMCLSNILSAYVIPYHTRL